MSTGKLDQSLDDIVKTTRPRRTVRNRRVTKTTATVPTGGVVKKAKATRNTNAAASAVKATANNKPVIPVPGKGESKIVVTGLVSRVSLCRLTE